MSAWAGCELLFFSCLADRRTTAESGMLNREEEEEGLSDDSRKLGPVRFGPKAHILCAANQFSKYIYTSHTYSVSIYIIYTYIAHMYRLSCKLADSTPARNVHLLLLGSVRHNCEFMHREECCGRRRARPSFQWHHGVSLCCDVMRTVQQSCHVSSKGWGGGLTRAKLARQNIFVNSPAEGQANLL